MHRIVAYIKFLCQSFHLHGIHSPFVFQLEKECLRDANTHKAYRSIANYRTHLKGDNSYLSISDLGAGSRITKSATRRVSHILRHSATTKKRSELLYRLVSYTKAKSVLELGTNLGVGTQAMALNSQASITSIEGCPNLFGFSKAHLSSYANVTLINGHFNTVLSGFKDKSWDLVFMDGHHNKAATLNYFEALLPQLHNNSILILDDINWSRGMQEAWAAIKVHPQVTITIDTFFWGLVFFRNEQAKEHFAIRL